MGKISTYLTIEKYDKDGGLLLRKKQLSRSWTKHFFDLFYILLGYNTNTLAGISDIFAAAHTLSDVVNVALCNLSVGAVPGGVTNYVRGSRSSSPVTNFGSTVRYNYGGEYYGIVVGSNNAAVTPTDNALGTKIAHGNGAGQLEHGGSEIGPAVAAAPNATMYLRRYFTNDSGGNVTVEECGLYSPAYTVDANYEYAYIYCICHDVTGAVVVADTEILVVTYTVGITV